MSRRRPWSHGLLAAIFVAGACSSSSDERVASAESTTTTTSTEWVAYQVPAMHPSDWGAPVVALPDAPRPDGASPKATADPAFYDLTTLDPIAVAMAEPGDVLRSEPAELTGALVGALGWRILYRSTTAEGDPAVVSGMVVAPVGPAPTDGRPVAAWAHGTTGIADRCAPSANGNLMYDDYGAQARRLLDQGFVVTASDYHGLGTSGVHSYHVSEELVLATVDSVTAVHRFETIGRLAPSWVVMGHSEGGLAALVTDQRSAALAELDYRGAVVAAPSARLGSIAQVMFEVPGGRGYGALLLEAAAELDPTLDPEVVFLPAAEARIPLLTHGCWEEAVPGFDDLEASDMLTSGDVAKRLAEVLDRCCRSDSAKAVGPLLVVHGGDDESLPAALSEQLVQELCAAGVAVEFRTYPGATHDGVLAAAADDSARWLADRLADDRPASTCETI